MRARGRGASRDRWLSACDAAGVEGDDFALRKAGQRSGRSTTTMASCRQCRTWWTKSMICDPGWSPVRSQPRTRAAGCGRLRSRWTNAGTCCGSAAPAVRLVLTPALRRSVTPSRSRDTCSSRARPALIRLTGWSSRQLSAASRVVTAGHHVGARWRPDSGHTSAARDAGGVDGLRMHPHCTIGTGLTLLARWPHWQLPEA